MKLLTAFILACTALLIGCSKDNTPPLEEVLVSGPWIQEEHYFDFNNDGTIELDTATCYMGDEWIFRADASFEYREGATICEPGMPLDLTGEWAITSEGNIEISTQFFTPLFDFKVISYSENELVLGLIDSSGSEYERVVLRK